MEREKVICKRQRARGKGQEAKDKRKSREKKKVKRKRARGYGQEAKGKR